MWQAVFLFETHFPFSCQQIKGTNQIAVLKNAAGFTLVLMTQKEPVIYPQQFHTAWILENAAAVDGLCRQLTADGIVIAHAPRPIRGSYGFYFDSLFIEIGGYQDTGQ